jgi:hypothetical protein
MRLVMISFAAVALSSCCLAAVFIYALHIPTQPRSRYPASWITTTTVANPSSRTRHAHTRTFSRAARRAFYAVAD